MNVQNTLLKDLVKYRFLMIKLWHVFFCISSCYCCWVVSGFGSVEILYIKSPCGILALWDRSFLWGGAFFQGKHIEIAGVFYPDQYPPAGFLKATTLQPGWDWGELGNWLSLKNLKIHHHFWGSEKKSYPDPPSVCGRSTFQPPNGRSGFWVVKGLNFQTLGECRYAWWWPRLVKIQLSDLFDWAHPSSSPPVLLTKNGPT